MKILMIGGTQFVGLYATKELLARGHDVVHFNRGKTNKGIFPDVETIYGDRLTDLNKLNGSSFDAVVDTCGYFPRAVETSSDFFLEGNPHYLFISTISVYKNGGDVDLGSELAEPIWNTEEITGETYGGLKVSCEQVIQNKWGENATILRPGLIVGPGDYTERFPYWPLRFSLGGEILVPDVFEEGISSVDVRDLANFTAEILENKTSGTYNVDNQGWKFGDLMESCMKLAPDGTKLVKISTDILHEQGVEPWRGLPVWAGPTLPIANTDLSRTVGLQNRPIDITVADTLDWVKETGLSLPLKSGLSLEKEKELLSLCTSV